ncbi:S46 family peptidase [Butyricimonas synergistica]|uniref:S46 family peptidase n=1 Tax=Butyricimonas synergistica TaxID=544644 RepID=UPI0003775768|nr:S46 family peptidase [Butyricimonas synergistica]
MKKGFIILFALFIATVARADGGMWLLTQLNQKIVTMQEMGCKLSAEKIFSMNHSSLKDAIVGLGTVEQPFMGFCTGEIVSGEGLMVTNHHCGLPYIQQHSTVEHDYLGDGFWAYDRSQELSNPGLTASILEGIEDVTEVVNRYLKDEMRENERDKVFESLQQQIVEQVTRGTTLSAQVVSMFNGNQYFLFVYKVYRDVRLVGAPPRNIGNFGGDTDNWVWPRHTGDFSLFRIYTDANGEPADYSPNNIPLKPKHVLPISLKGVEENDFTMVMGFPGMTNRYLSAAGLQSVVATNDVLYKVNGEKLRVMREGMEKDPKTKIQYAVKYAQCANTWKYACAQNAAVRKLNLMGGKERLEQDFTAWVNNDPARQARYGKVLPSMRKGFEGTKEFSLVQDYVINALYQGGEAYAFAFQTSDLLDSLCNRTMSRESRGLIVTTLKRVASDFFKDFNGEIDARVTGAMLQLYAEEMPVEVYPDIIKWIKQRYKGNFDRFARDMNHTSIFMDEKRFNAFVEHPDRMKLENDLCFRTGLSIGMLFEQMQRAVPQVLYDDIACGSRLFVRGLLEREPDRVWAPDANFTIRMTYGKVCSYTPRDGVRYNYQTEMAGIFEKESTRSGEYEVSEKLAELYRAKDFAPYGEDWLPVCFITNNDITGGNSGSPVINANGELVGIAFDGNAEAMSGDLNFERNLQRCICLDVRYLLFIVDKYAGAHNLIREMNIVR